MKNFDTENQWRKYQRFERKKVGEWMQNECRHQFKKNNKILTAPKLILSPINRTLNFQTTFWHKRREVKLVEEHKKGGECNGEKETCFSFSFGKDVGGEVEHNPYLVRRKQWEIVRWVSDDVAFRWRGLSHCVGVAEAVKTNAQDAKVAERVGKQLTVLPIFLRPRETG